MAPSDEEAAEAPHKEDAVTSPKSEIDAGSVSPSIASPIVEGVRGMDENRRSSNRKRRKISIAATDEDELASEESAKTEFEFDADQRTSSVHLLGHDAGSPAPFASTSTTALNGASSPAKMLRGSGAESPHSSASQPQHQHKIRKLKLYSVEEKIDIIDYAKVIGNRAAGREFNVAESSIREWRKNEEKLRRQTETPVSAGGTPRFEVAHPKLIGELDRDMVNYINRRRDDQALDWYAIRDQARELWTRKADDAAAAASLLDDAPPFSAADMAISMGWVARFMQRNEARVPKIPPPIVATANALANGTSSTNNNNFNKPTTANNTSTNNNTSTTTPEDRQPISMILKRDLVPTVSPSGSVENDTSTRAATTSSSAKRAKRKSDADADAEVSSAASINETISAILNGALGGIPPTNAAAASVSPSATATANSRRKCHQPRRAADATLLTTSTELAADGVASTSKVVPKETWKSANKRPPVAPLFSTNGARMPANEQPFGFGNLLFGTNKTNTTTAAATAFAMAFNAMMNSHNNNNNNNNNNNSGAATISNNRMSAKAQPPNPIFPSTLNGHYSTAAIQAMMSGLNPTALSPLNYFNGANSGGAMSAALNLSTANNNKHNGNNNNNNNNNKHHSTRNGSYSSVSTNYNHKQNNNNVNTDGLSNGVRKSDVGDADSIGARNGGGGAVVDAATPAANCGNAEMAAFFLLKSYMSQFGISGSGTSGKL